MKKLLIIFCVIIFCANIAVAQNISKQKTEQAAFVLGFVDKIQSAELNETRIINIYLPEGYSPDSAATYPVIYLLDGSANEDFIHIAGIVQFLSMIDAMPKSIIIGIANVDRKRDFTFPASIAKDKNDYPTTGGSAKFIAFIENELQPFIQKKYKTNNSKSLIGQSLGGLLATEVLLKKPWLFNNYFIVSPSLWWDNESILLNADKQLGKYTGSNIHVYISVGTEGKIMEGDAKHLADILQNAGRNNFHTDFVPLPGENHLTILHNSIYKEFEMLYRKKPVIQN